MSAQNKISYNKIANDWDEYRKQSKINKCIKDFIKFLPKNAKVLDIGCGCGFPIDSYLDQLNFQILGVDIADNMIKKANELNLINAKFVVCDFMDFKTDKKFDAIIAFDSLWHIEEEKQEQIYAKIANLLKINGYFIFTHGIKKGTVTGEMFSNTFVYSALDKELLKQTLIKNGFKIISWLEKYQEKTTGTRDLLTVVKKIK